MVRCHILQVVENNTVPPDIRVWREAITLKHAGYDVTVISPKNNNFPKSCEVIDGIKILRHPSFNGKSGKLNQVIEYANALFWEMILSLKLFVTHRFHAIHAANPPDHVFLMALAYKIFGVKFIFDHHDLAPELYCSKFNARKSIVHNLLNLMEKLSCHTADVVISTNESYKKHIIKKYNIMAEKIFVVRNDPELPRNPEHTNFIKRSDNQMTELLYVGTINNQDGVDLLVRTLNILVNRLDFNRVRCTVVGDGGDLPHVKKLCIEMGMEPYFCFTGYVYGRRQVQKFIEVADICLETAPKIEANSKSTFIKIMEYMSAGKPIVAFDMDETRYSAQGSAILIEPGNLVAFAQAIKKLANDPDSRIRLGEFGRNRILTTLNWENSSKELLRAYHCLQ